MSSLVKCLRVKLPDLLITCLSQPWPSKTSQGKIYVSVAWRCESNLKIYRHTFTPMFCYLILSLHYIYLTVLKKKQKNKVILEEDNCFFSLISRLSNSRSADTSQPGSDRKNNCLFLYFHIKSFRSCSTTLSINPSLSYFAGYMLHQSQNKYFWKHILMKHNSMLNIKSNNRPSVSTVDT